MTIYVCLAKLSEIERFFFFSFFVSNKQNHADSANQTGSSASIWTTIDDCFLLLRARLSTLEFCVHGT